VEGPQFKPQHMREREREREREHKFKRTNLEFMKMSIVSELGTWMK
jgi:hypothetical protein